MSELISGFFGSIKNVAEDTVYFTFTNKDGGKITCCGKTPRFVRNTPLILEGDYGDDGYFCMQKFSFSASEGIVSEFLIRTKTLSPRLSAKVTRKINISDLYNLSMQDKGLLLQFGLSSQQADSVIFLFSSVRNIYKTWNRLVTTGLTQQEVDCFFSRYNDVSVDSVLSSPYSCCLAAGVGLDGADKLALSSNCRSGLPFDKYYADCNERLDFLAHLVSLSIESDGDTFLYLSELEYKIGSCNKEGSFGKADPELLLCEILINPIFKPVVDADGRLRVYLTAYYQLENEAARHVKRILSFEQNEINVNKRSLSSYDDDQKNAVIGCLGKQSISVVTGGPGTGKTTVMKAVVNAAKDNGYSIKLCAPTGRASARLKESCGYPASTIHRAIGVRCIGSDNLAAVYNESNQLVEDVIIIDESSMIDLEMFVKLFRAVKTGGRVIFVGDPDQLPSVSPGKVLFDLIESGVIQEYRLNTIHRQKGGSSIVDNAYAVLHVSDDAKLSLTEDSSFAIESFSDHEELVTRVLQIFQREYDVSCPYNLQILTSTRKGDLGKDAVNQAVCNMLPGRLDGKAGFALHDKIMMIHNSYDEECRYMNGDIGIVDSVAEGGVYASGIARKRIYIRNMFDVDYAYAATIHKSQGSEYDHVVIILDADYPGMLHKDILYTAITRAKKKVTILYTGDALEKAAVRTGRVRNSGLAQRIREAVN